MVERCTRLVRAYPFGYEWTNVCNKSESECHRQDSQSEKYGEKLIRLQRVKHRFTRNKTIRLKSWPGPACLTATHMSHKSVANRVLPVLRAKVIPPAGVAGLKTGRKVYWATVGNRRPNVVSLVIDNNSSFLARLRPLICHTYATQNWTSSQFDF